MILMVLYDAERANKKIEKQEVLITPLMAFYDAVLIGRSIEEFIQPIETAKTDLEKFDVANS